MNISQTSQGVSERNLLITDFTNSVIEGPLNNIEYQRYSRSIESFYNHRSEIPSGNNFFINPLKSNEEIIESNKKGLMELRRLKGEEPFSTNISDVYKRTDISKLNQCGTCQRIKIERSHHCKMCQKCVLKMDHHCPWLANCIGFFNYKFFFLIHLYGTIATAFIFFSYWETLINMYLNYNTSVIECVYISFVYIMNFALMSFLIWLLWTNVKLIINGETIIEQSDRERFPSSKSVNLYDMGWRRNFTNVFGDRWYLWFIPAFSNTKGQGLFFETKKSFFFDQ